MFSSLDYLHRISSQFQVPQQVEIMNMFALLDVTNLKQAQNHSLEFPCVCKSHECCRLTSVWFLKDSQISTRFFSKLMLHKRRRFWRPDRLLILFEDMSRTCRLLRFSNPSITFSWFPLLMQRGKRTYLKRQGHDTHEYACTHKEFYFIHSHLFSAHKY